jgi:hypothetical protein
MIRRIYLSKERFIFNWGINDAEHPVFIKENRVEGVQLRKQIFYCPYYRKWQSMIRRCYSVKFQHIRPTYLGCTVDVSWKYFSNFEKWVDSQPNRDWENCDLDKDLLVKGNKVYSPETCVFLDQTVNCFITDNKQSRGSWKIGVCFDKSKNKFKSDCRDPFMGRKQHIGYFNTELEAHKAWQAKKHEYACLLAEQQSDPRVAEALCQRYAPDKDWSKE